MKQLIINDSFLTEIEKIGIRDFLNKIHTHLKNNLLIIKMIGSKLSKNFDKESDIDLFILVEECNYQIIHKISAICSEINLYYDINISPIVYSLEEHNKNVYFQTMFVRELDKGMLLYGTA
jgi:predicted nucleotidyltransferase